ncbi:MAG TPA: 6-carboxytetrahydropterin synthase [Gemmatimonadaceae bacterium]|nr:6-carboxytetrahydropterin synthase [Gemmatimonadaceae bacterium]
MDGITDGQQIAPTDDGAVTRTAFRVSVTKDYLVFASAHFITFEGHRCEALHGHNYRVGVVLEGGIDATSWYVFDFVALKRLMKRLCDEIDHRVLLPLRNPRIAIGERAADAGGAAGAGGAELLTVHVDGRLRYVFPKGDCALLEIPNTTVEMLAQYLAGRVRAELESRGVRSVTAIEVEVEENFGQSAVCREER